MNRRALVTLVLGQEYAAIWRQICQPNWQRYADKFHLDLICLDQPLDTSQRAQQRSPAWQKCLILSQPCVQCYEQVVWMDADILINHRRALNVFDDVPVEKVGAAEEFRKHAPTLQGGFAFAIQNGADEASFATPASWQVLKEKLPLTHAAAGQPARIEAVRIIRSPLETGIGADVSPHPETGQQRWRRSVR